MSGMNNTASFTIPTCAELEARGEKPEILFWVGCTGSFDERAQKITKSIATLLHLAGIRFAILGEEETCTGDPARRAGHEFLFQMQAMQVIQTLNRYGVKKIVTGCPHCFNTFKNEYPDLGANWEVIHHTQLIRQLLKERRIAIQGGSFKGKRIVFHDPCYLGRSNGVYEVPREIIIDLDAQLEEMKRNRSQSFCCGAGGAQIFKEAESGKKEVHNERAAEALQTRPDIIATACPFCNIMLTDGVKHEGKEKQTEVKDIAELVNVVASASGK